MPPALPPKLRIARWISIVGHPFVLSLLLAGIAAALVLPPGEAALVVTLVAVGSIVPMLLYLRREVRAGRSNFDVSVRRDRGPMFRFAFLLVSLVIGVLLLAGAPRSIVIGTAASSSSSSPLPSATGGSRSLCTRRSRPSRWSPSGTSASGPPASSWSSRSPSAGRGSSSAGILCRRCWRGRVWESWSRRRSRSSFHGCDSKVHSSAWRSPGGTPMGSPAARRGGSNPHGCLHGFCTTLELPVQRRHLRRLRRRRYVQFLRALKTPRYPPGSRIARRGSCTP